ncbi:hypothetical protein ACSVC9_00810 [Clostridium sp. LBM24168]
MRFMLKLAVICVIIGVLVVLYTKVNTNNKNIPEDAIGIYNKGNLDIIGPQEQNYKEKLLFMENRVKNSRDYYDLLFDDNKMKEIQRKKFKFIITYSDCKDIFIPKLNLNVKCKTIIIPDDAYFPEDSTVIIDYSNKVIILKGD